MVDLKLENDEGILLQTTDVCRYWGNNELELFELYLTNKNLISVYDKSTKIFSKEEIVTEKIALSSIKIVNEKVQIAKVNNADWGIGMQILFTNGTREHYVFSKPKKELQIWIDAITDAVTMKSTPITENEEAGYDYNQKKVNATINAKTSSTREKGANSPSSNEQKSEKKYIYCCSCGERLNANSKFCNVCGTPTGKSEKPLRDKHCVEEPKGACKDNTNNEQKIQYEGKIYKCPSCGEVLKAFEINCPACGYEIRGIKSSSAVKEFALKLEAIESKREYEKPRGLFSIMEAQQRISKTDEQKISLIKSFSVPNSKEDMLEFMILAISNMNMSAYDSTNTNVFKSEKEINAAWFSKVQQVYEKAKRSYSADNVFKEIKLLYDECNKKIARTKRKGVIKWVLLFGWIPILFATLFIWIGIYSPIDEKKEVARLEAIVEEIEEQLEDGKYKYALMNAEGLIYSGSIRNDEQSRKWEIEREVWIDTIIEEAAKNGVILERSTEKETEENDEVDTGGFFDGFKDGLQPGLDSLNENMDEFNSIMNGESTSAEDDNY